MSASAASRFSSSQPVRFSAHDRAETLRKMAEKPLDVLIIGGGITGVGCALDAVSRGLRVGIVEADDWASGTSSRSSKMIHGGLRYLATGDIGVVRESLRERAAIQRNAAHMVRPLSMLLPAYGAGPVPFDRAKIGAGLWAYEALGHRKAAGSLHQWRSVAELTRLVPNIALFSQAGGGELRGAHHYHDDSADDCRLVMSVLRAAVIRGALAVNGASVRRLLRDGDRVIGAAVSGDAAAGHAESNADDELEIEARVVVNATGVWAGEVLRLGSSERERGSEPERGLEHDELGGPGVSAGGPEFELMPSKGIHLTVRRDVAGIESGIAFFEQMGNANVFIEPWQEDLAIIGTTDAPYDGDLSNPEATEEEIEWLLRTANQFLRYPLERSDVIAAWAGLRPLVTSQGGSAAHNNGAGSDAGAGTHAGAGASRDVSRRHLLHSSPGVVTITGGKLTAYRAMAEEAIDAACQQLFVERESQTLALALDGCQPPASKRSIDSFMYRLEQFGVSRCEVRHLLRRHGRNADFIASLIEQNPELAQRLHPERPYLAAEVVWAEDFEQARSVTDILQRRTRIALETADPHLARAAIEDAFLVAAYN